MPDDFFSDPVVVQILHLALALLIALVVSVVVTAIVAAIFGLIGKKEDWARRLVRRVRMPFRALLLTIAAWIAVSVSYTDPVVTPVLDRVFQILTIGVGAWFVCALLVYIEDQALNRYRIDVRDNRHARRVRTQMTIIRRVTVVVVVVVAIGAALLTFPAARTAGASLLASAGVLSIVAGLAAQSSLTNIFAGMQLAFSDAIRIDDVVIVENEWGRIEEITLTYVVVHIWDDRRMVLPTNYFTTMPFQNWTRTKSELLGAVEFDLDWRVDPNAMREELRRSLEDTELWDGRVSVLQVTDAVGGFVRIRILVTAVDAPTLFDLRCHVRERMVSWLRENDVLALPHQRVELGRSGTGPTGREGDEPRRPATESVQTTPDALFSGDSQADERGALFTGSISTLTPEEARAARESSDGSRGGRSGPR